jgi:two-component system CheB/CheR fusion protein
MLVFSEQDVILDPPFSRLDLISCRNLLIYLGADLQRKLVTLFHYALSPGGSLFLGSSETVGELADLFTPLERKAKLYQRKEDSEGGERAALGRFLSQPQAIDVSLARFPGDLSGAPKLSPRELTEQALLQQVDKAAALVNAVGDVLYLHGRSGLYLEPAPGEAGICNLLQMARDGLRRALTTTLHRVASTRQQWSVAGLRVKTNGSTALVNLTICPVVQGLAGVLEPPLYLVILEQAQSLAMQPPEMSGLPEAVTVSGGMPNASAQIAELHEELQARDEHLKAAKQELETSNEELMSSNEEMQSVNEELQSSNEELETSKEELQSINEELSTVNTELQIKLADLSRANNDMNNLLAGTGIATLFLDHSLRVLRFTPAATALVNLIPSDLGRPVSHIVSNLVGYGGMVADAQAVLNTLIPKAVDVQTTSGATFTMRILPYRTLDNVVEGVVITFTEITKIVHTREALRKANEQLRQDALLRDAHGVAASLESSNRPVGKPIERTSS